MNDVVFAADLGGTNLRMAVVGRDGSVHHVSKYPVPKAVSPARLMDLIDKMSAECRNSTEQTARFCAVAFTAPAPVPLDFDGVLSKLPNLPTLVGMDLKHELERHFSLPVHIENDATAAAIGENWIGASKAVKTSVCVTLGTGIGGGIIIDGEPHRGPDGIGGEIGHICVEPDGHPCGCGSRGCVEQYASATAIVRIAKGSGLDVSSAADVYRLWEEGDERAEVAFRTMARYLGIMLAGLANALNPEMFVICGGVTAGWDAFAHHLSNEVRARAYKAAADRSPIVRGSLGDNAGFIGAARSAFLSI